MKKIILPVILVLALPFAAQAETLKERLETQRQRETQDRAARNQLKGEVAIINVIENTKILMEVYNETARAENKPVISNWELNVEPGAKIQVSGDRVYLSYLAEMSDNRICLVLNLDDSPVNQWLPRFGTRSEESSYNNEYNSLEIECGEEYIHQDKRRLIKIVDGKDILDNLNPGPNSGAIRYTIRDISDSGLIQIPRF